MLVVVAEREDEVPLEADGQEVAEAVVAMAAVVVNSARRVDKSPQFELTSTHLFGE